MTQYGTPTPLQVFLYIAGGPLGFAVLTLFAFSDGRNDDIEGTSDFRIASAVHFGAVIGNIAITYVLTLLSLEALVMVSGVFLLVGVQVTVCYNLLLLLLFEEFIAREIEPGDTSP